MDAEEGRPRFVADALRRLGVDRAGVVDERVEPPELADGRCDGLIDRLDSVTSSSSASTCSPVASSRAADALASSTSLSAIATRRPWPRNSSATASPIPRADTRYERDPAVLTHVCASSLRLALPEPFLRLARQRQDCLEQLDAIPSGSSM